MNKAKLVLREMSICRIVAPNCTFCRSWCQNCMSFSIEYATIESFIVISSKTELKLIWHFIAVILKMRSSPSYLSIISLKYFLALYPNKSVWKSTLKNWCSNSGESVFKWWSKSILHAGRVASVLLAWADLCVVLLVDSGVALSVNCVLNLATASDHTGVSTN